MATAMSKHLQNAAQQYNQSHGQGKGEIINGSPKVNIQRQHHYGKERRSQHHDHSNLFRSTEEILNKIRKGK